MSELANSTIEAHGYVAFHDGSQSFLPDAMLTRIVYALTTLQVTPVINHVSVEVVIAASGERLWPPS